MGFDLHRYFRRRAVWWTLGAGLTVTAALPVPKALFSQRPERCRRRESSHFRTHVCVSCSDLGQHGTTPKVPIGGVDAQPGGE